MYVVENAKRDTIIIIMPTYGLASVPAVQPVMKDIIHTDMNSTTSILSRLTVSPRAPMPRMLKSEVSMKNVNTKCSRFSRPLAVLFPMFTVITPPSSSSICVGIVMKNAADISIIGHERAPSNVAPIANTMAIPTMSLIQAKVIL